MSDKTIAKQLREYAANPGYSHCDYADTMREAAAALDREDYTLDDVDLARKILVELGYAISPSREPSADARVDRLAAKLAAWGKSTAPPAATGEAAARPDASGAA